jgi:hypothetical protein
MQHGPCVPRVKPDGSPSGDLRSRVVDSRDMPASTPRRDRYAASQTSAKDRSLIPSCCSTAATAGSQSA